MNPALETSNDNSSEWYNNYIKQHKKWTYRGQVIAIFRLLPTAFIVAGSFLVFLNVTTPGLLALLVFVVLGGMQNDGMMFWKVVPQGMRILFVLGPFGYAYYQLLVRGIKKQWGKNKKLKKDMQEVVAAYIYAKILPFFQDPAKSAFQQSSDLYIKARHRAIAIYCAVAFAVVGSILSLFLIYHYGAVTLIAMGLSLTPGWVTFLCLVAVVGGVANFFRNVTMLTDELIMSFDLFMEEIAFWRDPNADPGQKKWKIIKGVGFLVVGLFMFLLIFIISLSTAGLFSHAMKTCLRKALTGLNLSFNGNLLNRISSIVVAVFLFPVNFLFSLVYSTQFVCRLLVCLGKALLSGGVWSSLGMYGQKFVEDAEERYGLIFLKCIIYGFFILAMIVFFILDVISEALFPTNGATTIGTAYPAADKLANGMSHFFGFQNATQFMLYMGMVADAAEDGNFVFEFGEEDEEEHDHCAHDHGFWINIADGCWGWCLHYFKAPHVHAHEHAHHAHALEPNKIQEIADALSPLMQNSNKQEKENNNNGRADEQEEGGVIKTVASSLQREVNSPVLTNV